MYANIIFFLIILCSSTAQAKIFQIGFNRCGTTTLKNFFEDNGIKSLHNAAGAPAAKFFANYKIGERILNGQYQDYIAYFDMEDVYADPPIYIAQRLFKKLDKQYPGSKFILNIRNKNHWLQSRSNLLTHKNEGYLEYLANYYALSNVQLLNMWSNQWDEHIKQVMQYFKDRPQDLLVFDIERDDPQKICDFFANDFKLNKDLYKHVSWNLKSK